QLKLSAGFKVDDLLLFNAGEFNKNKNQQFLIHSMTYLMKEMPNVKLILAGEGDLLDYCMQLADRLGVGNQVHFLGFRSDIDQLMPVCDIAVAASKREGLPVNVMEAM